MKILYFILILGLFSLMACKKHKAKTSISYNIEDINGPPGHIAPNLLDMSEDQVNILSDSYNYSDNNYSDNYYEFSYPLIAVLGENAKLTVKITTSQNIICIPLANNKYNQKGWFVSGHENRTITLISSSTEFHFAEIFFIKGDFDYCSPFTKEAVLEVFENGDKLTKTINLKW